MFDNIHKAHVQKECNAAILRIADGDPSGLDTVYRYIGKMILAVALQITENTADAEDVLQDVMLKLIGSSGSYQKDTNAVAWVLTIARNLSLNKVKSRKRILELDALGEQMDPDDRIERLQNAMTLADALSMLSKEDQLIVRLKNEAGLTHKEIALVMEMTDSGIEKRYERALNKLHLYLTGENRERKVHKNEKQQVH
ncbi:MAG: RNA polymerase sigma factor [Eubacteriales bacterium]